MDVIINYIINEAWKCRRHFGNPLFQFIKSPLMQHDVTQCLPLNGTIDAVGASRMRSVCAAATDHGLAILSIGHTVSLFSCKTEDSADQHVRKMFILFCCPACQTHSTSLYRNQSNSTINLFPFESWADMSTCHKSTTWQEMMSCIAIAEGIIEGFTLNYIIPWVLFSVYVHSVKRQNKK